MIFLEFELLMGLAIGRVTPDTCHCVGRGLCLGVCVKLRDVAFFCGTMHDSVFPGL